MTSIRRLLVANRGEIALRIIRACRELGIETVQVYSEADRDALPVRTADRAVCIGGVRPSESYLNPTALVSAALTQRADAIHPGYGFLAENAEFARLCVQHGVTFVGPSPEVITLMGDKARARQCAAKYGVPIIPGSAGPVSDQEEAAATAGKIGYPIVLKAASGGGGRGMRVVNGPDELKRAFEDAKAEAKAAFGDDAVYIEKYFTDIRHIEIQILSDGETVLHLGERDCTIQRRNQKLLEESPSPVLSERQRQDMAEAAVNLCRGIGYTGVGTVEFVLDVPSQRFYFIEMNTRIQVEHPVTEMVTGHDLVKLQIQVGAGQPLSLRQDDVRFFGHSIECRINAEDPERNFAPSPGTVIQYVPAGGPGIRVDSHLYSGYRIPPYYDSMISKVIAWGRTRDEAIARMRRALLDTMIEGVMTTIPFHIKLLEHDRFLSGRFNTRFVQEMLSELHV